MRISDWRSDVGSAEQLGSNTLDHLVPGIAIGALRRGLLCEIDVAPYGQWRQQILDPASALYAASPDAVLLALDHASLLPEQLGRASWRDRACQVGERLVVHVSLKKTNEKQHHS